MKTSTLWLIGCGFCLVGGVVSPFSDGGGWYFWFFAAACLVGFLVTGVQGIMAEDRALSQSYARNMTANAGHNAKKPSENPQPIAKEANTGGVANVVNSENTANTANAAPNTNAASAAPEKPNENS
ncbi:MAG: hypothetical protein LBU73_06595 [Helicobacteraceae bacterium]|nr:hypothetical protein [Helicobacteraceae bacterium]